MSPARDASQNLKLLSELLLVHSTCPEANAEERVVFGPQVCELASSMSQSDLASLEALANSNHVIIRAFEPLQEVLAAKRNTHAAEEAARVLQRERERIRHALTFLGEISAELERAGCPAIVIKSLDHWPDLGSDLDLYTDADATGVVDAMRSRFGAEVASRSWGDRLANKWNFVIPGLPELVEVHVGRLGQTGEQTAITRSLSSRARMTELGGIHFRVAASEDRFVISTLQRMYRHFYIRLCDIIDNARLLEGGSFDFAYLQSLGVAAGLWQGIATYLNIISQYVESYRGRSISLPLYVTRAAKFGMNQVRFRRDFLRVSILPHSLGLYTSELGSLMLKGELRNSLRLSLLPCLATAAALEMKITGSDKGIW